MAFASNCSAQQKFSTYNPLTRMFRILESKCRGDPANCGKNCDACAYIGFMVDFWMNSAKVSCEIGYKCAATNEPTDVVWIQPEVASGSGQSCGCLESVLFREGVHQLHNNPGEDDEEQTKREEKECFQCGGS